MAENVGDSDKSTFMIACPECEKLIPEANVELHRLRACGRSNRSNSNSNSGSGASNDGVRNRGTSTALPRTNLRTTTRIAGDEFATVTSSGRPRKTRRGNGSGTAEDSMMQSSSSSSSSSSSTSVEEQAASALDQNATNETREIIDLLDDPDSFSTSNSFDPMDVSDDYGPSTANRAAAVDLTGNDAENEVVKIEEDRKLPARDASARGSPNENDNDNEPNHDTNTNDDERKLPARENNEEDGNNQNNGDYDGDKEWSCPRCTLFNKLTSPVCDACQYHNVELQNKIDRSGPNGPPERTSRQGLQRPSSSSPSSHLEYIGTGALIGAAMGLGGNWLMGRDPLSGAVNGGSTGAMGGALLHEVLQNNNDNDNSNNAINHHHSNSQHNTNPSRLAEGATRSGDARNARNNDSNDIIDISSTRHAQSTTEWGSSIASARSSAAAGSAIYSPMGSTANRNTRTNTNPSPNQSAHSTSNQPYRQQPRASYRSFVRYDDNGIEVAVVTGGNSTTHITRRHSSTGPDERQRSSARTSNTARRRPSDGLMDLMLHHQLQIEELRSNYHNENQLNRHRLSPDDTTRLLRSLNRGGRMQDHVDIDGMNHEELLSMFGDGTENMGASVTEISRLPTHTVGEAPLPEDARQCLICLEDFEKGETRTILPCLHGFHQNCCSKWLTTNGSCPVCKHRIG